MSKTQINNSLKTLKETKKLIDIDKEINLITKKTKKINLNTEKDNKLKINKSPKNLFIDITQKYKNKEERGAQSALMYAQAAALSDKDIKDLSEYIITL